MDIDIDLTSESEISPTLSPNKIRVATTQDIPAIVEIHNQWILDREKPELGFFLGKSAPNDYVALLGRPDIVVLVAEKCHKVDGYIFACKVAPEQDKVTWLDIKAQAALQDPEHWHIDQIGVDRRVSGSWRSL